MSSLRICMLASEAAPFAKTGGLADVASALTRDLVRRGHDARLFLPMYKRVREGGFDLVPHERLQDVPIELGGRTLHFSISHAPLPDSEAQVWLVRCPQLYERESLYTEDEDEPLRFALLTHAALHACQWLQWAPDVLHCNDWHTALTPLILETQYAWDRLFANTSTLLSIHNIGYQGNFPIGSLEQLGLDQQSKHLHSEDREAERVSFLRTGVLYADGLSTVSRTYANEIRTAEFGMGLEELLEARERDLVGIVNGVDYGEWSPDVDPHLETNYGARGASLEEVLEGKRANKQALCRELELPSAEEAPLFGVVSRLSYQKGFELLPDALTVLLQQDDACLAVLGSGEEKYERYFEWLRETWPGRVAFVNRYDEGLAHRIEAGADLFLMPSRYEPCGLNQMYSLRYGTPPIVRRTGGLADTVQEFDPASGEGNGFVFERFDSGELLAAMRRGLTALRDSAQRAVLIENGMAADWSWDSQGQEYVQLYQDLMDKKRD